MPPIAGPMPRGGLRTTKLMWYGRKVTEGFRRQIYVGVEGAGKYLEEFIKHSFGTSKSGQVYRKPGFKVKYTASATGEVPAVVSGKLRASISHKTLGTKNTATCKIGIIGTRASEPVVDAEGNGKGTTLGAIGSILELGLGSLKGPHPFLRPALDKNRVILKKIITGGMAGMQIAQESGIGFWEKDVEIR